MEIVVKLAVVADSLNRAAAHSLVAECLFFLSLRLLVDKRVILLVATHEIVRRSVTADVAVDARRIHVIRTADVLFDFFVFVRHAGLCRSGMRHLFRDHHLVKLFTRQKTELYGRFAQTDLFLVSVLCNLGGFVVTDVRVQSGNEHEGVS